jgi:hypothetical protein
MNTNGKANELLQLAEELASVGFGLLNGSTPVLVVTSDGAYFWDSRQVERQYLLADADQELYFRTTNEDCENRLETGPFIPIMGFENVLRDMEDSDMAQFYKNGTHGPLGFVFYDLAFITPDFAIRLLKHLKTDLQGYSEDYVQMHFDPEVHDRIALWKEWLQESVEEGEQGNNEQ